MSKNLRGYSGTQIQINLDEITASSITATNATFTNLSIGTYSITTLNVSDLVATGVIKFTGLTAQSALNTDDHNILIHDPTTNRIYKFTGLTFSPINNRLTVPKLTVENGLTLNQYAEINSNHDFYFREILPQVGGDKGVIFWENIARIIGRRTSTNLPELQLVNETARQNGIDYQISLQTDSTQLNSTDIIIFRVNTTRYVEITPTNFTLLNNIGFIANDITANDITANDVSVNGTLTVATLQFTSGNIAGNLTVQGTTTCNSNLVLNSVLTDDTDNNNRSILFQGLNNVVHSDANLLYNPSSNLLTITDLQCQNITASNDVTITNDLDVTGRTDLRLVALNTVTSVNTNTIYPLLIWDYTNVTSKYINVDTPNLNYDTTDSTLHAPNVDVTNDVTIGSDLIVAGKIQSNPIQTSASLLDFPLVFVDTNDSNTYKCDSDLTSGGLTYNPNGNRLFSRNIRFDQTLDGSGSISITGNGTFNDLTTTGNFSIGNINSITSSGQFDIPILAYNSTTGIHTFRKATHGFYHTPNNNTLYVRNIITNQDGTNTGTITTDRLDVEDLYIDTTDNNSFGFLRIPFLTGSNQLRINSNNFLVQPSTGIVKQGTSTSSLDIEYPLIFYDSTNKTITTDGTVSDITYNPNRNRVTLSNITIDDEVTLNNIQTNSTSASFHSIPFFVSNQIRVNPNFEFQPSTGLIKQSVETKTDSVNYQVIFYDSTNKNLCSDSQPSQFTYNASSNKLSVGNIRINNETEITKITGTANIDFEIPFINSSNQIRVNDSLTINPSTQTLKVTNIVHGVGLNVNYTNTFYRPAVNTIDESTLTTTGTFGTGNRLLWNSTGVGGPNIKKEFGLNVGGAWDFEGNTVGTLQLKNLGTAQAPIYYYGTWKIELEVQYHNTLTGNNDRVTPKLVFMKKPFNGSYTEEVQVTQGSQYFRHQQGMIGTLQCSGVFHATAFDNFRIDTLLNIGGTTAYTSTTTSRSLQKFKLNLTYLGSYGETVL